MSSNNIIEQGTKQKIIHGRDPVYRKFKERDSIHAMKSRILIKLILMKELLQMELRGKIHAECF